MKLSTCSVVVRVAGSGHGAAEPRLRERLAEAGLRGSMSRTGNPYDNAAGGELHENPETRGGLPARLGHGAGRDRPAPLLPGGGLQPQTSPLVPGLSASGG